MLKIILVAITSLSISACTGNTWVKEGATELDLKRDTAHCRLEATEPITSGPGVATGVRKGIATDMRSSNKERMCMQGKGYSQKPSQ